MTSWAYTPFIWPLALSAIVAIIFASNAWSRRKVPGATAIAWLMLGAAWWCIAYGLRLSATDPGSKLLWGRLQFIGIAIIPLSWLFFGIQYTGKGQYLTWPRVLLALFVPILTLLLLWTNDAHGLMDTALWDDVPGATVGTSPFSGWWFWVFVAYSHAITLIGAFLVAKMLSRTHVYTAQIGAVLLAVAIPWALNVLHLLEIDPIPGFDLTPTGFVLSGMLATWAVVRHRFLDIVPVAHSAIISTIADGILVSDNLGRIVEMNPAAQRLFESRQVIGQSLDDLLRQQPSLLRAIQDRSSHNPIEIMIDGSAHHVDLQISALRDSQGKNMGQLFTWRDISQHKQATDELRAREQFLKLLNGIATAAMENPDLRSLLQFAARQLPPLFAADACLIGLWDERKSIVSQLVAAGNHHQRYLKESVNPEIMNLIRASLESDQPLAIADVDQASSSSARSGRRLGVQALSSLTMSVNQDRLGTVIFLYEQAHRFTSAELDKAQQAVTQIALAIHRIELLTTAQKRNMELQTIQQASLHLSSSLELQAALESLLEHALRLVPAGDAHIFLYDGQHLTFKAALWAGERQLEPYANPRPAGLTYTVARTGERIVVQDASEHALFRDWRWQGSIVGFPLHIDGRVIGVMNVASNEAQAFEEHSLRILGLLADQAAIAVRNAQLFAEIRAEAARRQAVNAVATAAAGAQNLQKLLELSLAQALQALDLDTGCICIADDCATAGSNEHTRMACQSALEAVTATYPVAIRDVNAYDGPAGMANLLATAQAHGISSIVIMPIASNRTLLGKIALAATAPRTWPDQDIDMLQTISQQIGDAAQRLLLLAKVREQALQLERVMHAVPDGVILLDREQRIVLANMVAEDYLQLLTTARVQERLETLAGHPLDSLLSSYQGTWQDISAGQRTFEIANRPLDAHAKESGQVLVLHEVTETRRIQAQAQQQQQLAAVGRLAAGIAHDFNNLLTGIIGLAELLLLEKDPTTSADLQSIIDQGQRGAHLIRQILDFSRQSVSVKRPTALGPFLKEMAKFWERTVPERIQLHVALDAGEFTINADPAQIQEALTNIVLNAQDAMPESGTLTIRLFRIYVTSALDAPLPKMQVGEWAAISLSDTGRGMSAEVQSRLFEPFFTTKAVGDGTGLGLAQVYGIVTQHGGRIDVSSALDRGTTITLFFPLLAEHAETQRESKAIQWGKGECILLVEDDPIVLTATSKQLESLGYQVIQATNGQEGLAAFQDHETEIELVVSDMVMPEMGATQLYYALKERAPTIKMIITSGYPLDESTQLIEQEIVGWLQKPFAIHELAEAVRHAIDSPTGRA